MNPSTSLIKETYPDSHHDHYSKTIFGFWIYLLSDFMLFATLFAVYAVLHKNTFGGPSSHDLFHLPITLFQTLILLSSTFSIGIAGAAVHRRNRFHAILFSVVTLFLGSAFIWIEWNEYTRLFSRGLRWDTNGFLSSFFTLTGTYALHLLFGMLYLVLFTLSAWFEGINRKLIRRFTCVRMFWQFLNIIWIFIFTVVYLMGVIIYD